MPQVLGSLSGGLSQSGRSMEHRLPFRRRISIIPKWEFRLSLSCDVHRHFSRMPKGTVMRVHSFTGPALRSMKHDAHLGRDAEELEVLP